MIVVSNATPLIYLGKLGQLNLLLKLYTQISIPGEVYNEVVVNGLRLGAPDAMAVNLLIQQEHIQVVAPKILTPLPDWVEKIDLGEVETILLAQQINADWVLIDNLHARVAARRLKVPVKGTIGILLAAVRENYLSLDELEWLIEIIKSRPELWISDSLCDQALTQARQMAK